MASGIQIPVGKKGAQEGSQRARVVQPDAGQIYHLGIPKEAVASIAVVDVDVVVKLTSGETIVLAEAGLTAMSNANVQVQYSNAKALVTDLFNQSGLTEIPAHSDLAQNIPAYSTKTMTEAKEQKTNSETPDAGGNSGAGMSSVTTTVKIDKIIEKVLQAPKITAPVTLADVKRPEVIPATSSSPASSKSSKEEELIGSETNALQAGFYSNSKSSVVSGVYYGGYGDKSTETNSSISAAMLNTQVAGFSSNMDVKANALNGVSFQKILRLSYTGVSSPDTITISNLPNGTVIVGAQKNADGSYTLKASDYAQSATSKIYDIPVQYALYPLDSTKSVHEDYALKIDFAGSIGTNVLHNYLTLNVKVVDGATASELETYAQGSGSSVVVLSAQGANYEFNALGNNTITGGANADTIHSAVGHNVLNGGGGVNTISFDQASSGVVVDLANGTASSGNSNDSLANFQKLVGSAYNDVLRAGKNTLSLDGGSGGNDTFDPNGAGTQANPLQVKGSATGKNILDLSASTGSVQIDAGASSVSGAYGNVSYSNISVILGSQFDDTIRGPSSGSMTIDGGGGADIITGGLGSLTLTYANAMQGVVVDLHDGYSTGYGTGRSTLSGNIQHIIGSSYSDTLIGNKFYTRILDGGAGGNDTFDPGGGGTSAAPVVVIGSASGSNLLTLANAASGFGVIADLANGTIAGGYGNIEVSHIQQVIGTRYDDTMIAASDTTLMDGGSGGNDLFDVNHAQSITVKGGLNGRSTLTLANETVQGTAGAALVDLGQGKLTGAYGTATLINISNVIGTASGDDTMIAGGSAVNFQAGNGNVSMVGSIKDDTLIGGSGNATIVGNGGNDVILALKGQSSSTVEIITGSGDDRVLIGDGTTKVELYGGDDRVDIQSTQAHVTLDFSKAGVAATGGISADLVNSLVTGIGKASVFIAGTGQVERLIGTAGNDTMRGTSKTNYFDGGVSGNDIFDVSALANATVVGAASGQNTLKFHDMTMGVQVDFSNGSYLSENTIAGQFSNIANLNTTAYADKILLGSKFVNVDAGAGDDTIIAGTADAKITTGDGLNTVFANNATSDSTAYSITGGGDSDIITVGRGAFTIQGNVGSSNTGESDLIIVDASATSASTYQINGGTKSEIRLGQGSATVKGGSGDDTITAGAGDATITGNGGNDQIILGSGTSNVTLGAGNDKVIAGSGAATIAAGNGNNTISVLSALADTTGYSITGGSGNDSIMVGRGNFTINGNDGAETIIVDSSATAGSKYSITGGLTNNITLGLGSATVTGGTGNDTIVAGVGNSTITGNGGDDSITLGAGIANVTTGSGNDTIFAGSGAATIAAGSGNNTIRAINSALDTTTYSITGGTGNDTITVGRGTFNITGTTGTETITVDASSTVGSKYTITGGTKNTINLGAGSATVTGGTGNDTITADTGNATITGNGGNDFITLGTGTANVTLGTGNDTVTAGSGAATISSGGGTNIIRAQNANSDTTRYNITGGSGIDVITVGRGSFTINGNGGAETITVDGSSTANSTYSITGGTTNTINLNLGTATVTGGTGNDSITAGEGNATIVGNGGADTIKANSGTVNSVYSITGSAGADQITLGLGNTTINTANGGNDTISITAQGNYTWTFANGSAVTVNMITRTAKIGTTTQTVTGGTMQNIIGSTGADVLIAGAGTLLLDGNAGNDTFDIVGADVKDASTLVIKTNATSSNTLTFANSTIGATVDFVNKTAVLGNLTANLSNANIRILNGSSSSDKFILDANSNLQTVNTSNGGNDTIIASSGNATSSYSIITGSGNDDISLGLGNFTVTGGGGADTLNINSTQQGNITLQFSNSTVGVNANLASGIITQGANGNITVQNSGSTLNIGVIQNVIGTASNDILIGNSKTLLLDGGTAGNDIFDMGGAGTTTAPVTIKGAASGNHTLTFANDTIGAVTVDIANSKVTGNYGNANLTSANIKTIIGSTFADTFNLSSANMTIKGYGGNDTITVNSPTANSTFEFSMGAGNDRLNLSLGNYTIDVGAGNDTLSMSSQGNYLLTFANSSFSIDANMASGQITKSGGNGNLTLANTSYFIQSLIGSAQNDTILGGKQTTLIDGGGGKDKFILGDSWASGGNITIKGASTGGHTLSFEGVASTSTGVAVDLTTSTASAGTGTANLSGVNIGTLIGGKGNDTITISNLIGVNGGGGNDTLVYKGVSATVGNTASLGGLGFFVKNIGTVDLSKNVLNATSGYNYSITTQDIMNMTTSSNNITIKTYSASGVADTHVVTQSAGHSYSENAAGVGTITAGTTSYTVNWVTVATH